MHCKSICQRGWNIKLLLLKNKKSYYYTKMLSECFHLIRLMGSQYGVFKFGEYRLWEIPEDPWSESLGIIWRILDNWQCWQGLCKSKEWEWCTFHVEVCISCDLMILNGEKNEYCNSTFNDIFRGPCFGAMWGFTV